MASKEIDPLQLPMTNELIQSAFDPDNKKWYKSVLGVEAPTIAEEIGLPGARTGRFSRADALRDMVRSHVIKSRLETELAREAGPTQGQVFQNDPSGGLASRLGVPLNYPPDATRPVEVGARVGPLDLTTALQPSRTHPGAQEIAPVGAMNPNAPLDPIQSGKLAAQMQLAGQRPLQPNEAQIGQSRMDQMVDILVKQGTPLDQAKLEVYGSKGHLYQPGEKPGSLGEEKERASIAKTKADTELTTEKTREQSMQNVFNPVRFLQEEDKRREEIEKLRLEVEQKPEELDIKKRLAGSLITHRTKTRERADKLQESIIARNMSAADRDKALSAVNRWKVLEAYMGSEDFSKDDQSWVRAQIAESLGVMSEMEQKYPGVFAGLDVGAKHRAVVKEGQPAAKAAPKDQGDLQARYNALRKAGKTPEEAKRELGVK